MQNLRRHNIHIITICLLLFIISTLIVYKRLHQRLPAKMVPQAVKLEPVQTYSFQPELKATGTLVAYQGVTLKFETAGRVKSIYFKSGDLVPAGASIAELENDMQKADLNSAQAQLNLSQLNYNRQKQLYGSHSVSQQEVDQATTTLAANQAALEKANATLAQTIVRAPFSGHLGIINIHPGDYVESGDIIANLANLQTLYVDFSVPETAMSQIQLGQTIILHASAYPKKHFIGHISAIETVVDSDTRTLAVRATVDNTTQSLLPGNFVAVAIWTGHKQSVILIPALAIQYTPSGQFVYKIINQRAVIAPVKLGAQIKQNVMILQGLKAGDIIVTAGTNKLHAGSLVMTSPMIIQKINK